MKAGREHRVPLVAQALTVLDQTAVLAGNGSLLFPSATGRTLSQSGMPKLLRQLAIDAVPLTPWPTDRPAQSPCPRSGSRSGSRPSVPDIAQ